MRRGRWPAASRSAGPDAQARILLVEDNPVNLMVAQRLLQVLGAGATPPAMARWRCRRSRRRSTTWC